jgi:hypothetical protein
MNYKSDGSVIRLHQMLSDDENPDDTLIDSQSPNFESTCASQFPFDEVSIDNISACLSNLQIAGTPITPAMARPITRSNSDLPTTKSKEIILPDLPDQRRPRFKQQLDDEYESQSDLVLENLPEIQETEMNPDESAFADSVNPTENEITALISEIRIPAPLIE